MILHAEGPYREVLQKPTKMSLGVTGREHGAGSSSVAKKLAHILGYSYMSAGDVFRRTARRYGNSQLGEEKSLQMLSASTAGDLGFDTRVDRFVQLEALQGERVIEGKTAVPLTKAHLLAERDGILSNTPVKVPIYTVLLTCDPIECAVRALFRDWCNKNKVRRELLDQRTINAIEQKFTFGDVKRKMYDLENRMQNNMRRWNRQYQLNTIMKSGGSYDLVIDTTRKTVDEVVNITLSYLIGSDVITPQFGKTFTSVMERLNSANSS